ncbi:MAG TPA: Mov34/MPN/PAD-1 family protein [Ktedonobacteraceae bacterium]|nr:Mov34/MPN/PAD-1 family protein [Ktedonobacteraceae bacterium]
MRTKNNVYVSLSAGAQKTLALDAVKRRRIEACGILIGTIDSAGSWLIETAIPLRNIHDSPTYFEFAPEDLLAVELANPGKIVGAYHSHPSGYARPSQTDRQNMQRVNESQRIPWAWLIICGPFPSEPVNASQHRWSLPASSILAYHHFPGEGLRAVPVLFAS